MIHKSGAIESPCLHPLWILICSESNPHCNIAAFKSLFKNLTSIDNSVSKTKQLQHKTGMFSFSV